MDKCIHSALETYPGTHVDNPGKARCHNCGAWLTDNAALLEALEAANVPHTMPAVHKMTDVVAGCPGCMARAAIIAAKGEGV